MQAAIIALHLICAGSGTDTRVHGVYGSIHGSNGSSAYGNAYERKETGFEDELEVHISDGEAKVRLPRQIVPKIHGGEGGWFAVKDLQITDNEITGKVTMNFTNAPYLHIDRLSGAASVSGRDGSFAGQCHAVAGDAQQAF